MTEPASAVQFTVKELLGRLENKIDNLTAHIDSRYEGIDRRLSILERDTPPIPNGELRMGTAEANIRTLDGRVHVLENDHHARHGVTTFRSRTLAAMVGLASIVGASVGVVLGLLGITH